MDSSGTIQIFSGDGTSEILVDCWKRELNEKLDTRFYRIDLFDEHSVRDISTQNPSLIVIPGGFAVSIQDSIAKMANQINRALKNTSALYASCAGTIVSSSHYTENEFKKVTNWSKTSKLDVNLEIEVFAPYSLPFELNRASLYNYIPIQLECVDPTWKKINEYYCYHALGPGLLITDMIKSNPSYDVIEYYQIGGRKQDRRGHFAATVMQKPKEFSESFKNRLFTGVHPECGMHDLARIPNIKIAQPNIYPVSPYHCLDIKLKEYEILRQHRLHENFRLLDLKTKPIDQSINRSHANMAIQKG